jgi:hypothetical protein
LKPIGDCFGGLPHGRPLFLAISLTCDGDMPSRFGRPMTQRSKGKAAAMPALAKFTVAALVDKSGAPITAHPVLSAQRWDVRLE